MTYACATRAATDFSASCLLIPQIPGCTIKQFSFTEDDLSAFMVIDQADKIDLLQRTSIPLEHEGDCVVIIFYNDEITFKESSTKWFSRTLRRELRMQNCYNVTFIGGRVDLLQPGLQTADYEPCVAGIVIYGANVSAASVALPKLVSKLEQAELYIDKLLSCDVWQNSAQKKRQELAAKLRLNVKNRNPCVLPKQSSSTMFAMLFDQYRFLNSNGTCNMLAQSLNSRMGIPVLGYSGMETTVTGCNFLPKTEKFKPKSKLYFKDTCTKTFDHSKGAVMLLISLNADAL